MLKIFFPIILVMVAISSVNAQEIIYFDKNWNKTKKSDAHFYREVQYENGLNQFTDHWMSGEVYAKGALTIEKNPQKHGPYTRYHKTGGVLIEYAYDKGQIIGQWRKYFEDGALEELRMYDDDGYRVMSQKNQDGAFLVENGTGIHVIEDRNGGLSKGPVEGGRKEGVWKGYNDNGDLRYVENYKNGELAKGESYDSLGNTYSYTEVEEMAKPVDGYESFYQMVAQYLRYPAEARKMGVQGKVYVQFIIDKNGELIDPKIVKGIGAGCDVETIRVIKKIGQKMDWIAPKQRGQGVKQKIILPITFRLG